MSGSKVNTILFQPKEIRFRIPVKSEIEKVSIEFEYHLDVMLKSEEEEEKIDIIHTPSFRKKQLKYKIKYEPSTRISKSCIIEILSEFVVQSPVDEIGVRNRTYNIILKYSIEDKSEELQFIFYDEDIRKIKDYELNEQTLYAKKKTYSTKIQFVKIPRYIPLKLISETINKEAFDTATSLVYKHRYVDIPKLEYLVLDSMISLYIGNISNKDIDLSSLIHCL